MSENSKFIPGDYFEFLKAGRKGSPKKPSPDTTEVKTQSEETQVSVKEVYSVDGDWSDELL